VIHGIHDKWKRIAATRAMEAGIAFWMTHKLEGLITFNDAHCGFRYWFGTAKESLSFVSYDRIDGKSNCVNSCIIPPNLEFHYLFQNVGTLHPLMVHASTKSIREVYGGDARIFCVKKLLTDEDEISHP
jgi:hypothetical protein